MVNRIIKRLFCQTRVSGSASRYFLFAATFNINGTQTATQNFGHIRNDFPTIKDLKKVVTEFNPSSNIVILSVCEVNKDEYHKFFSEQ